MEVKEKIASIEALEKDLKHSLAQLKVKTEFLEDREVKLKSLEERVNVSVKNITSAKKAGEAR